MKNKLYVIGLLFITTHLCASLAPLKEANRSQEFEKKCLKSSGAGLKRSSAVAIIQKDAVAENKNGNDFSGSSPVGAEHLCPGETGVGINNYRLAYQTTGIFDGSSYCP